MILSFRPSAGSWLGVLAYRRPCNHASQCGFIGAASCSSVTVDLCGPGSYQCCCGCISRQVASCVKDLPCWVEGRCPFPCLRGSCKRRSGFRRQNAFWRSFAYVRKRAPSRIKRYPILFRNHRGIPDFVNFPKKNPPPRGGPINICANFHDQTR